MTFQELKEQVKSVELSEEIIAKFVDYKNLLLEWNEKINLTSITDENEIVEKHFLDCLLPLSMVDLHKKSVADLGTGAGFPGIVWAICYPDSHFDLIEATGKKCKFLQTVVDELGLKNVTIINKRAEMITDKEKYDLVTSRAMAALPIILELGIPLLKVDGMFLALKGSKGHDELNQSKHCLKELGAVLLKEERSSLPSSESARINLLFAKKKPTPKKYPRDWANIIAKPL